MPRPARLLPLLFALACSAPPPSGPHVLYSADPASLDNPFPDARLLGPEGFDLSRRPSFYEPFLPKRARTKDAQAFFADWAKDFGALKGFGNYAPVLLRFSEAVNPETFAPGGEPRFVYLERDGEGRWRRGPRARLELPAVRAPLLAREGRHFAMVSPEVPLTPGGQAVLALLAGPEAEAGARLVRSADYHARAEAGGASEVDAVASAFGVSADDVVFSMPLLPSRVSDELRAVRDWAQGPGEVTIAVPAEPVMDGEPYGVYDAAKVDLASQFKPWLGAAVENRREGGKTVIVTDHVGQVVIGRWGSRDLRTDGVFDPALLAQPGSAPEAMLDFVLTLPKGPRPAGGWKVLLGGHGINNRNSLAKGGGESFCLTLAELFAENGFGCLGIDAPAHGKRGNLAQFLDLRRLFVTRDNFRQAAADQLQLLRLVRALDLDHDGAADLDPHPGYFGNSMGGIMGATFVGLQRTDLDVHLSASVLNVPGANLASILTSDLQRDALGLLLAAETDIGYQSEEYEATWPLVRALAQALLDAGDPVHYAGGLEGKRVLVQQALGDKGIPAESTQALVQAAQLDELTGAATSGDGVRGFVRLDPAEQGITDPAFDPHLLFWRAPNVRRQAMRYFASEGTVVEPAR